MTRIGIIVGSTRPGRFGIQPAQWLFDLARGRGDAEYVLVDIEAAGLPLFDEPQSPFQAEPQKPHSIAWQKQIGALDGFIFVTPEYNHSTSGALKNALDFLYYEWNNKPAAFVSYGGPSGGSRAVEHLRGIMAELRVFDIREQILLPNYYLNLDERGQFRFGEAEEQAAMAMLDELGFWATQMQAARDARIPVAA